MITSKEQVEEAVSYWVNSELGLWFQQQSKEIKSKLIEAYWEIKSVNFAT